MDKLSSCYHLFIDELFNTEMFQSFDAIGYHELWILSVLPMPNQLFYEIFVHNRGF